MKTKDSLYIRSKIIESIKMISKEDEKILLIEELKICKDIIDGEIEKNYQKFKRKK